MQEPVFEGKIEEPVFTHVYEEKGFYIVRIKPQRKFTAIPMPSINLAVTKNCMHD